jgi:hypothetical protein
MSHDFSHHSSHPDKENLVAAQLRLEKAKKAVEKAQRQTKKAPKPTANDDNEYESEEKDDVDDEDGVVFSSSVRTSLRFLS